MKDYGGIQSPFDDAIVPGPGGKGDLASSDPGVPIRDAPSATSSEVGPMTLTTTLSGSNANPEGQADKIKPGM